MNKRAKAKPREPGALARRGLMFVLSSPSGAGKTTLSRLLLEEEDNLELSISVTTRKRRASEVDGVHYHFISQATFEKMRDTGGLLEWAMVHGNYYGTPREAVEQAVAAGRDVLFDIDWQGTLQLYEQARADVASVFILPPDMNELRSRLERRAEDSNDVISARLAAAVEEIRHWEEYDYVLVNHDLDDCFPKLQAILAAERLKRERTTGLAAFVRTLTKS